MGQAADFNSRTVPSFIQTTDATLTNLSVFTIQPDQVLQIKSLVVARRTGGASGTAGDAAAYEVTGTFKNVGGTISLVGAVTQNANEDQVAWDATLTAGTNQVILQVTGAANNNINWSASSEVVQVKF